MFQHLQRPMLALAVAATILSACSDEPSEPDPSTTHDVAASTQATPDAQASNPVQNTGAVTVAARDVERGDDLFLKSVDLSPSDYQTMIVRRVHHSPVDVIVELGGVGGGGWDASEYRVRLVLPPDKPIIVRRG